MKEQFINSFTTLFAEFKTKLSRSNESIVNFLPEFIRIYINAGKNMACVNRQEKRRRDQPPWWDADYQLAKAEKYSLLNKFRRTKLGLSILYFKLRANKESSKEHCGCHL